MNKMSEKKKLWKVIAKIAEKEVEKEQKKWPPACAGVLYQPKRPKR